MQKLGGLDNAVEELTDRIHQLLETAVGAMVEIGEGVSSDPSASSGFLLNFGLSRILKNGPTSHKHNIALISSCEKEKLFSLYIYIILISNSNIIEFLGNTDFFQHIHHNSS